MLDRSARLPALDRLRGLVIVLMALDHVRDFFGDGRIAPTDVEHASPGLFATRWVTHLCAPGFVLLAGASAHLAARRHGSAATARFLFARGLWLIFLELTVVHVAWRWRLNFYVVRLMVLWALGGAMIAVAPLLRVRTSSALGLGAAIVGLHNVLDSVHAEHLPRFGWAWMMLHEPGEFPVGAGVSVYVLYPLLPWIGVMLLGLALGGYMTVDRPARRRELVVAGIGLLAAFVVLRLINRFGDPERWIAHPSAVRTLLSFLNVEKYPPSLCFVLATSGILALLFALLLSSEAPSRRDPLLVFGQVPMFFYVVHIFLAHGAARWIHALFGGEWDEGTPVLNWGLPAVYATWALLLAALYPVCAAFGHVKRTRSWWWLRYV